MGRSKKLLALGIVCSLLLGGCGNNTQTSTESSPEPKAATEAASEQNQEKAETGEKETLRVAWWGTPCWPFHQHSSCAVWCKTCDFHSIFATYSLRIVSSCPVAFEAKVVEKL